MSNLFKSKKTETQKTEIDPAVYQNVLANIELANQLASVPFTPYQGLLTAPFTQDYMRGEAMTRAIAGEGGTSHVMPGANAIYATAIARFRRARRAAPL